MNQIKKTLERAKTERLYLGVIEKIAAETSGSGKPVTAARKNGSDATEPRDIVFKGTRVVDVPRESLFKNRVVALDDDHPAADSLKLLRTRIFQLTRLKGWNTIQVTGFGMGEGKSTLAVNLAISIARDTRQTSLLVDLDFRRPSVGRLLNLNGSSPGLKSYFLDETPLDQLFLSPGIDKLTVITAGGRTTLSTELVGSPKMEALINDLKQHYADRYIIFDTPGVTTCPDPLIISEYVDAILLVGRAGHTTQESIKATMERIPKQKILGVVMNDVPPGDIPLY